MNRSRILRTLLPLGTALLLYLPASGGLAAGDPAFMILSPVDGDTLSSPITISVATSNAPIGRPAQGLNHLHYSVDGGPEIAIYRNEPRQMKLEPGPHTLSVELAGPTHRPLLPEQTVSFTVRE